MKYINKKMLWICLFNLAFCLLGGVVDVLLNQEKCSFKLQNWSYPNDKIWHCSIPKRVKSPDSSSNTLQEKIVIWYQCSTVGIQFNIIRHSWRLSDNLGYPTLRIPSFSFSSWLVAICLHLWLLKFLGLSPPLAWPPLGPAKRLTGSPSPKPMSFMFKFYISSKWVLYDRVAITVCQNFKKLSEPLCLCLCNPFLQQQKKDFWGIFLAWPPVSSFWPFIARKC